MPQISPLVPYGGMGCKEAGYEHINFWYRLPHRCLTPPLQMQRSGMGCISLSFFHVHLWKVQRGCISDAPDSDVPDADARDAMHVVLYIKSSI